MTPTLPDFPSHSEPDSESLVVVCLKLGQRNSLKNLPEDLCLLCGSQGSRNFSNLANVCELGFLREGSKYIASARQTPSLLITSDK